MRLVDLEPRWFAQEGRYGQGVIFRCPHCPDSLTRLAVPFAAPLDGGPPVPLAFDVLGPLIDPEYFFGDAKSIEVVPPAAHWTRTGDTFETVSITPSVDASASGHWHGFITGGQCR